MMMSAPQFYPNGDAFVNESREYLGLDQKEALDLKAYVDTKWGFLKNVININSFFSSGFSSGGQEAGGEGGKAAGGAEANESSVFKYDTKEEG